MKCPKCQHENPRDSTFCGKCATRLGDKAQPSFTKTIETPQEELARGSIFADRYQVIEELGKGGMGKVYRVLDQKLNEEVALKLIKPEIASDKRTLERFKNELKLARKVSQKNVGRMFDLGEETGTHYITMEYVPGEDLKSSIKRFGQLPIGKSISIAKQLCEGLSEAHGIGVVHRDLKPSNIMIDKQGNARIMDFGIARSLKGKGITGAGVIIGTPEYMSPEQVEGKGIDQRSDIYSLGVILYEMLTGRVPFEGDTPFSIGIKHKSEFPKNPRELNPQLPEDLSRLILKCMEKDKETRFQSPGEIRIELDKIEEGLPTTESAIPRSGIGTKRKKLFLYGSSAILLVLLTAAGISIFTVRRESIDSIAILPLENLSEDPEQEYIVDGMHEALITNLSKVGALRSVIARTSVMRYRDSDKSVSEIARELGVDAIVEGSVLRIGDQVRITPKLIDGRTDALLWTEDYQREWRDILKLQNDVARAIAEEIQAALTPEEKMRLGSAYKVNPEAHEAYLKGRYYWNKITVEGTKTSLEYFKLAIEKDANYALAYAGMADAYNSLVAYGILPPKEAMPKAKAAAMKAVALDDTLAEAHYSLGHIIKNYDWDWAESEREHQRAIELNPNSADAHLRYGMYLAVMGQFDEAIREYKHARTLDPLSLFANVQVAQVYYHARLYDQAIEEFQKTLELDPNFPIAHIFLSWSYLQKGMLEEACAAARKGVDLSGGDPLSVAGLGHVCGSAGRRDEAVEALNDLKGHGHVAPLYLALIYIGLGENDQAFEWLGRSYEERDSWIIWLISPLYDRIRSDPRFTALQIKMNLD